MKPGNRPIHLEACRIEKKRQTFQEMCLIMKSAPGGLKKRPKCQGQMFHKIT